MLSKELSEFRSLRFACEEGVKLRFKAQKALPGWLPEDGGVQELRPLVSRLNVDCDGRTGAPAVGSGATIEDPVLC